MYAVETRGLHKSFGNIDAVKSLDLIVEKGELFALLGLNGAGKTTLIGMLTCRLVPTGGEARIFGHDVVKERDKVKTFLGVSPQGTAVAPLLTVRENLTFMCGIYGMSRQESNARADKISEALGLRVVEKQRAGTLSGGYARRLSIAMALVTEPSVLFLDEPTLGLDVLARRELWDVISSLKGNTTVLLTTHYLEEAEALADRIGIMSNGSLKIVGSPSGIVSEVGADNFEDAFVSLVKEG